MFLAHHKCLLHAAVETMEKTKTKFIHIDGETPSGLRQGLVDSFQRDANSPKVAILSIKAAGVGLTLTREFSRLLGIFVDAGGNSSSGGSSA